ncbi:MAG: hypothetical protein ACXU86_12010 [Archangium sp.]
MAEGDDRPGDGPEEHEAPARPVFEQPATLREPAAPRVPRVMPPSAVSVIPLSGEAQARPSEARLTTLQDAREATDALLQEILEEEGPASPSEPARPPAAPAREEDWPSELHTLPLQETED